MHFFTGSGVIQVQLGRMEELTVEERFVGLDKRMSRASVQRIPEYGMGQGRHMDTDLMGPARFKLADHVIKAVKTLRDFVMRHRVPALSVPENSHFFAVVRISPDGKIDHSALFFQVSDDDGVVDS